MLQAEAAPRLRIAVLAGGDSPERAVSLRSGSAVAAALVAAGHYVSIVDPQETPLEGVDFTTFDACFIALHGGAGEDGRVQQLLGRSGVPYTGSGPEACRVAMSKLASKEHFSRAGVPTPPYVTIEAADHMSEIIQRTRPLGYPLIIKPDGQGSSVGLSLVEQPGDLTEAVALARRHDSLSIAEAFIQGREFTVAMLDDHPLPLIEIVTPERVFSYEAKYASSLTEYRFESDLSSELQQEIVGTAAAAAAAIGTAGLARVDLMLAGDGRVWVLEVNTIPGLTPRSLAPQAALRAGIGMSALCDRLVRQCLAVSGVS